ncbi:trafficking protein particle complex subunit 5-like isoform X2 [Corticium candelabrum]|uniref:trafficking protein particle complex subunit 5-like isoform X2 n=1 Tax=Corticium candelabrum TaxID=121492 RepID=UPI002E25E463|nr:trafficking protein particle complex subunit 5-like isoform X2 [Corticium candelabrum]
MSSGRSKPPPNILDRPLSRGKSEVNLSTCALLFSEIVQYSQHRVLSVAELQTNCKDFMELCCLPNSEHPTVLISQLSLELSMAEFLYYIVWAMFYLWTLFGKEADNLEHATGDESTYYIIEKEPIINKFISVPKDKSSLNCASFSAGIVEGVLNATDFPAKVTAHWHKGTTLMIKFKDSVLSRERTLDGR